MNTNNNFWKSIGKLKVWQQRLNTYVGLVNFLMLFYLYIIESPMGLEWYYWLFTILVITLSIVSIDTIFIMPNALGYNFEKNPQFQELKKDIKEIKEKLL